MIFLCVILFPLNILAFSDSSSSSVVMDMDSGRILYSKNKDEKRLIASTTKIMTCIITIENMDLNKKIIVGDEVLKMYGTNIYVEVGEEISIRDLLYGLMLRSGNDASVVLAKNVFGSYDKFIKMMNKKAKELNMNNTIFNNPHGLDDDTKNYSTAYDMSLLSKYCYKNKIYRKIISTKKYRAISNLKSYLWYNRNKLLYNYKYGIGGKNGYTPDAGKTFVSNASYNGLNLTMVSLNDSNIYSNHENIYNYIFKKYKRYKIVDKDKFHIDKNFFNDDVYIKKSFYYPLSDNEVSNIKTLISINNSNNKKVGNINIYLDNKNIGSVSIYKVKKEDNNNLLSKIKSLFIR